MNINDEKLLKIEQRAHNITLRFIDYALFGVVFLKDINHLAPQNNIIIYNFFDFTYYYLVQYF